MSKLTKKERLLHSLIGIKQLFNDLGAENLKNEIVLKDGTTETIDCYKEIEAFVVDFINNEVDEATPKRPILNKIWEDEDTKNIYDEYGRINETLCVCPNCGESDIYDFEYNTRFKCCSNCGQRIDWSDENDR